MRRIGMLICVGLALSAMAKRPVDYVEPRVDTKNSRWIFFSSACRPFGMVSLSPDTSLANDWGAGYIYDIPEIRCFSHIHGWQLFGIPVMPIRELIPGDHLLEANKAAFSHDDEVVRPGYHKIHLPDRGITAELTSTMRVGLHRYTNAQKLLIDLKAPLGKENQILTCAATRTGPREIEGSLVMSPTVRRHKPFTAYFVMQLNADAHMLTTDGTPATEIKDAAFILAAPTPTPLLLKVAISYTGTDGARKNLNAELTHWDFDRIANESADEWDTWLSKIEIQGGTETQRAKFYTDLWHTLLGRRIVSDTDGRYADNTGPATLIRQSRLAPDGTPLYPHHNSDGLWGSHWSIQNLWGLAYPKVMSDFCNTFLDIYDNGGLIPRGPSGGNYTYVMTGDQATPFITSAYAQGIRTFDIHKAYAGLRKNAYPGGIRDRVGYESGPNPAGGGMRYYIERGYVPEHTEGKNWHRAGAGLTMEYTFQDWCLAQLATALGKTDDATHLLHRSHGWTNLYNPATGYIHPRETDGTWIKDFAPVTNAFNARGFIESNSAITTWYTPHDYPLLATHMGGPATAAHRLHTQFQKTRDQRFNANGKTHASVWIDYGNQPGSGAAYIFNHIGHPWLAQYWARQVQHLTFGGCTPWSGYNDDEDQGQMAAVSALLALGLFDIQGGSAHTPRYELTAPIFDRITIHLDPAYYPGGTFTITVKNNSPHHPYIQSATLNGAPLTTYWFPQSALKNGGTLELVLGAEPNKEWGTEK